METMKVMRTNVEMEPWKHDVSQVVDETHLPNASRKEGATHASYTSQALHETHHTDASHKNNEARGFNVSQELGETH